MSEHGAAWVDQEIDPARRGAGHVCRCMACTPDMVPGFSKDDARYHDGRKCGTYAEHWSAMRIDGHPILGYTSGWFEGPEGWVLVSSETLNIAEVHVCACGTAACVTPRFGNVTCKCRCFVCSWNGLDPIQKPAGICEREDDFEDRIRAAIAAATAAEEAQG